MDIGHDKIELDNAVRQSSGQVMCCSLILVVVVTGLIESQSNPGKCSFHKFSAWD